MARRSGNGKLRGSAAPRALVDPFYYLANFQTVVASLDARYGDLWSAEERQFIADFGRLAEASRALLVRMVMRKGVLFRASRLNYPEIGDSAAALAPLLRLGWVDAEPRLEVGKLQALLSKSELVRHFRLSRSHERLQKCGLVELLRTRHPESKPFHEWCREAADRVYELVVSPLCERLRLMFFGNFHQDWTEFVLTDLGVLSYEKVASAPQWRPFMTRPHIDAFQQIYLCRQQLDAGCGLQQVIAAIPPPVTDCSWLEEGRQKLLYQVARAAERARDSAFALAVYARCTHPGARLRTIRLRERAREWQSARNLCLTAQSRPENEVERQQVCRLLPRLNRRLGIAGDSPRTPDTVPTFSMVIDGVGHHRGLEWCVRDHLARETGGSTVHYVENGLVNSMFGLLCWSAIFAPVPGAFFHDFQSGPADLSSGCFHRRRAREFADCFAELESDRYKATIRRQYGAKAAIQSPFVSWRMLSKPLLESALACIPAAHLKVWFEWIVQDVRENRAGFPDLVQFWPLQRRYRMIEVKGPGDRLQDNQRRVLKLCMAHQMPVAVCRVRWTQPQSAAMQTPA